MKWEALSVMSRMITDYYTPDEKVDMAVIRVFVRQPLI